jgi:hypothetical protein
MTRSDHMLTELVEASELARDDKLKAIAAFYGDGFASLMRRQVEAEMSRRAERKRQG